MRNGGIGFCAPLALSFGQPKLRFAVIASAFSFGDRNCKFAPRASAVGEKVVWSGCEVVHVLGYDEP
eukprot:6285795-Pyramimonas_sp.AAC.1